MSATAHDSPAIALLFATRAEAEPAMQRLRARSVTNASGLFAGRHPGSAQKIMVLLTGMGPEAAYRATRSLLRTHAIAKVINPGIAGSLRPDLPIGELSAISCAQLEADATAPFQNTDPIHLTPLPGLPRRRLISVRQPVFDERRRARLATRAELVDMEGAAIAWACRQGNVPCQMLKGISDPAGAGARHTLHRNLAAVSGKITARLFQQEEILAP